MCVRELIDGNSKTNKNNNNNNYKLKKQRREKYSTANAFLALII